MKQRILIVDDDPGIVAAIMPSLKAQGYDIAVAHDGDHALSLFTQLAPDLVLLDLVMPSLHGIAVCQRIRQQSSTPIIVVSVKGAEADIVTALDNGADDYLVKPFRLRELLARIRAVLRRGRSEQTVIQCADLVIDTSRRLVQRQGQIVSLTPIEYAVLAELVTHRNGVVTARQIVQRVWGPQYIDSTDYVKGVIRRLRVKLEPDPSHPRYILTEPHVGYRFNHGE
ncbi:response regulator transcription factor [Chloroflexus sp. MS-CIW-1]|jgi:two-component system KDP operon response regulator KdpE|uniref:response regulator transcription factor n=1 Tax=Chloroflexus sp. MS-CIW-1 TaxID=3055768 RepID=UPI001B29E821|nr:response regulator transcription factor [Chloroflexus sp. MS-CIW-1]MBO9312462.1 response regulator transcription factor [Chloroflexus sp.]MDN5272507.1 response regulator transcription factor [Chloroflexus sp. MS-CIW-1]